MPFLDEVGLQRVWSKVLDKTHPVGSLYWSSNSTNPGTLFGGTWVQIKDKFILAAGDKYGNGTTGGSADAVVVSHTHSIPKLSGTATGGNHRHSAAVPNAFMASGGSGSRNVIPGYPSSGSGQYDLVVNVANSGNLSMSVSTNASTTGSQGVSGAGKNMPPFETYYCWKRTA